MTLPSIWVFDEAKLEEALARYQEEALAAYPGQEERIRVTLVAVRDFLHSEHAEKLVMKVSQHPD
ncbi:MAG: hypothetical protein ABFS23_13175 [Pseudomonadota bacterium]